jgi:hypothetical protein
MRKFLILLGAMLIGACTSTASLKLVARDGGDQANGILQTHDGNTGTMTVYASGKTYNGTWVATHPHDTTSFGVGLGFGRWGHAGGGTVSTRGPAGGGLGLLNAADGSAMRCETHGDTGGGFGTCTIGNRVYDLQVLPQ